MSKPSVTIVTTGGTISSKYDTRGGENVPAASAEELVASVPELSSAAQVRVVEHSNVTSDVLETSTAFGLRDRLRGILADEETAGAVITHGTATMEETAYLLDLTLGGEKPVVITGAMRNAVARDADGPRNIFYAAKIAADPEARAAGACWSRWTARYSPRGTSSRCTANGPMPSPPETAGLSASSRTKASSFTTAPSGGFTSRSTP